MICENCWSDSYMRWWVDASKSRYEHYLDLLRERDDPENRPPACKEETHKIDGPEIPDTTEADRG